MKTFDLITKENQKIATRIAEHIEATTEIIQKYQDFIDTLIIYNNVDGPIFTVSDRGEYQLCLRKSRGQGWVLHLAYEGECQQLLDAAWIVREAAVYHLDALLFSIVETNQQVLKDLEKKHQI